MRDAKGTLRLVPTGRAYAAEVRPRVRGDVLWLELHRDDSKGAPYVELRLDEAQTLLRSLQSACDRIREAARAADRKARADAELERIVDRVAAANPPEDE